MKGVSSTAIFVLVAIGILVIAGLIVFWQFLKQNPTVNEFTCKIKQSSYCSSLINGENPNWDEIVPKTGCEKIGIAKPTLEECKGLKR